MTRVKYFKCDKPWTVFDGGTLWSIPLNASQGPSFSYVDNQYHGDNSWISKLSALKKTASCLFSYHSY